MTESQDTTYSGLKFGNFLIGQSVCFRDDGYQVDFGVQLTHEFDVDRFQSGGGNVNYETHSYLHVYLRVTSRLNEVEACVDTIVGDLLAVDPVFLLEV